jgi:hypothetical protein
MRSGSGALCFRPHAVQQDSTTQEIRPPLGGTNAVEHNEPAHHPTHRKPTTGGGRSIGMRVGGVPRRSRPSWRPWCPAVSRRVGGDVMETANMGLGRPDASVGESGGGEVVVGEGREPLLEHPDTPRWLTHELCKVRARRPSSWSWLVARGARRLRVETATSVAGPTRRCCTSSSRSTGDMSTICGSPSVSVPGVIRFTSQGRRQAW